ncbi:MAG: hypothetical protein J2P24_21205, partial [Streptosporangiales bacterium]|nr:hypothetical protein [Streptosporangiales bacterium]
MKSARVVGYWYATAFVLVASSLMRGISTPHVFPLWFVGAEFGGGIAFGLLGLWFHRGSSVARVLLLVAGTVVVLGAAALLVTGRGYEFAAVPAVLGVIATATGGETRGRTHQASVPAVGDWTPIPASGTPPTQPGTRPDGRPAPPQHGTLPRHGTRPSHQAPPPRGTRPPWMDPRPSAPPQHPTVPPQHGTLPPQQPPPPQPGQGPYPPQSRPPSRGAGDEPSWRGGPGPAFPASPEQPPAPAGPSRREADVDGVPRARARHAAGPPPDAEPRPAADP